MDHPISIYRSTDDKGLPDLLAQAVQNDGFSLVGGAHIMRFTTFTHLEKGQLTKNPETVRKFNERLAAKVEEYGDEISQVKAYMQTEATALIINYGVKSRAVMEAVSARSEFERGKEPSTHRLSPENRRDRVR
jgi:pyruvate/2-oxoacid:ferredoxin oxidoreductase alpha subunit